MSTQQTIFRSIEVVDGIHVTLGEPVPDGLHTRAIGNDQLMLEPVDFGHARSIVLQLAADQTVTAMRFAYDEGADYDAMVQAYTQELGPPTQSGSAPAQATVWQDPQTRFTLAREGDSVGSVLQDLAAS